MSSASIATVPQSGAIAPLTEGQTIQAGMQNLAVVYTIRDRLGNVLPASGIDTSVSGMNYVLTAPYNWWGGTEVTIGKDLKTINNGNSFAINLMPTRAGQNTLVAKLRGVPISCSNCDFKVEAGDYVWANTIVQPWDQQTKNPRGPN